MAEVKKAVIEHIGEVMLSQTGVKSVVIDVSTNSTPKTRYVIFQNKTYAFDLIKKFEANVFKIGDTIDFYFNVPSGNYFPNIWRIVNHHSKH